MTVDAHTDRPVISKTIGWAVFLGCSWTWCIGMFLPVLLVRDFGLVGWIVFAIPNVIGAAAMGWVMRRTSDSPPLIDRHRLATTVFSIVTIAFHLFFVFWIVQRLTLTGPFEIFLIGAVLLCAFRDDLYSAAGALVFSLLACSVFFLGNPARNRVSMMIGSPTEIAGLATVCLFGFALCPYLDQTFHRAYHAVGKRLSAATFAIGFGGFFLSMILFTLAYATLLRDWLASGIPVPSAISFAIGIHMMVQSGFTISIHLRPGRIVRLALTGLVAGAMFLIGKLVAPHAQLSAGEATYRLFMSFYGLVFPAYVWHFMIPPRGKYVGRTFAIAVLLSAPMYWMAFIEGRMIWAIAGVFVIIFSRFLQPSKGLRA